MINQLERIVLNISNIWNSQYIMIVIERYDYPFKGLLFGTILEVLFDKFVEIWLSEFERQFVANRSYKNRSFGCAGLMGDSLLSNKTTADRFGVGFRLIAGDGFVSDSHFSRTRRLNVESYYYRNKSRNWIYITRFVSLLVSTVVSVLLVWVANLWCINWVGVGRNGFISSFLGDCRRNS